MGQNWEEIHRKEDAAVVKEIKKRNSRSSTFLLLGIGAVIFALSIFQEMLIKMFTAAAEKANASGGQITFSEVFALLDKGLLVLFFILGIIALIFFSRSMLNWEKGKSLLLRGFSGFREKKKSNTSISDLTMK